MSLSPTSRLFARRFRQLVLARRGGRLSSEPPPLPPGRVVRLPGRGDVFVRDQAGASELPPVLLLHGWFASAELNWFGSFAAFGSERRVLAIDHRGHGRGIHPIEPFSLEDCADDAAALLDVLAIPSAIVVGFSMGGPIGLLLARRHPGRVAAVVTASTAAVFSASRAERWRWRAVRLLEIGIRLGLGDRLVARVAQEWGELDDEFAPYAGWLVAEFTRAMPRAVREAGHALAAFDARPWAPDLGVPAAAVITGSDSLVPPRRQEELAAMLGAEVIRLPDADHDAPVTAIAAFSAAVRTAVSGLDPAVGVEPAPAAATRA